jgi:hypothetical protein
LIGLTTAGDNRPNDRVAAGVSKCIYGVVLLWMTVGQDAVNS